ncbi:MAG: hypothetical protein JWM52_448 [Candidatus Saccharibacteria bacterium]|nr:hypothetical protein [Candidatus Saccharibacteria bacterium]
MSPDIPKPTGPNSDADVQAALEHLPDNMAGRVSDTDDPQAVALSEVRTLLSRHQIAEIVEQIDSYLEDCGAEAFLTAFLDTDDAEVRYGRMRLLQSRIGDKLDPELVERFLAPNAARPTDPDKIPLEPLETEEQRIEREYAELPAHERKTTLDLGNNDPITNKLRDPIQPKIDNEFAALESDDITPEGKESRAYKVAQTLISDGEGTALRENIDRFLKYIDQEKLLTLMLRSNMADAMATDGIKDKFDKEIYDQAVGKHFPALADGKPNLNYH